MTTLQEAVERELERRRAVIAERERKEAECVAKAVQLQRKFSLFMAEYLRQQEGLYIPSDDLAAYSQQGGENPSYFGVVYNKGMATHCCVSSSDHWRPEEDGTFSRIEQAYLWQGYNGCNTTRSHTFVDAYIYANRLTP